MASPHSGPCSHSRRLYSAMGAGQDELIFL
jgi:hypothetical protein